jgi:hypothetical protein
VSHALALIVSTHDPADELPRIDSYVQTQTGWLPANCHILMHAVGRAYGRVAHVTLGNLLHYLPKTNNPNCSAGFAHGLLIALGPQVKKLGPKGAAAECARAPTRYQRYNCIHGLGHAYARTYVDAIAPALAACEQLGRDDAADCAQGVYHDYWIAVSGLDSAHAPADEVTDPRRLCGTQPTQFVLSCWYRALLERPPKHPLTSADDIRSECNGLTALQRTGCVIGSSVIVSNDPYEQLQVCARLGGADAAACVRGVRAPALLGAPIANQLQLIQGCAGFDRGSQRACYGATRRVCVRGADSYEGPLETFS